MSGWIRATAPERLGIWAAGLLLCASCVTVNPEPVRGSVYTVTLSQTDGVRLDFRRFRHQVLMVDFFTTWAPTSLVTVPEYVRLYEKYRERGLAVVGVSLDELGAKVVEPFSQSLEIPYPVVLADERLRRGEGFFGNIGATPMLMIFDRDGVLVKIFLGHVPISEIERVILRVL